MPICKVFNAYGNILATFNTKDLGKNAILGRSADCDIPLKTDGTISRQQLQLKRKGNDWELENIGKATIYQNGEKIEEPVTLVDGDIFRLSCYFLVVGEKNGPSKYELTWTFETDNNQKRGVLWPGVNIIGCSRENDICMENEEIARHHLKITVQGDNVSIEKYNSSCRVNVNGKSISNKQVPISTSDTISLSDECSVTLQQRQANTVTKIQGASASGNTRMETSKSKPVAGMVILLIGLLLLLLLILIMQAFLLS